MEQDLEHMVKYASKREINILVAHVNADAATLLWTLVARDQIDNPRTVKLGEINPRNISSECMSRLIHDINRYTIIKNLESLRTFGWSFSIEGYLTNLEPYYENLTLNKAARKGVHQSMINPVHETSLGQISIGLGIEATRLKDMNMDFLEYFNLVQILLMRLDPYYDTTAGYHNHYSCGPNTQENQPLVMDAVFKIILSIMNPYIPIVTACAAQQCYEDRYRKKEEHSLSKLGLTRRILEKEFNDAVPMGKLPSAGNFDPPTFIFDPFAVPTGQVASPRRVSRVLRRSRRKSKKLPRKSRRHSRRRSRRNKR